MLDLIREKLEGLDGGKREFGSDCTLDGSQELVIPHRWRTGYTVSGECGTVQTKSSRVEGGR